MSNPNTHNTSTDNTEDQEEKIQKKANQSVTTEAIQLFMKDKLLGANGGKNFDTIIFNKGNGLSEEFMQFVATKPQFDELSPEQWASLANVNSTQFLREAYSIGAGLRSQQRALMNLYAREYTLDAVQTRNLEATVLQKSLDELSMFLKSELQRNQLVQRTFGEQAPLKKTEEKQIDTLFHGVNLTDEQKESVLRILADTYVSDEEIEGVISLFDGPEHTEHRQVLVKMFLPVTTLWDLKEIGVINEHEVRDAIRQSLENGELKGSLGAIDDVSMEAVANQIDPYKIIIPTVLFPDTVVRAILAWPGKKAIVDAIEETNRATQKNFEEGNELGLVPDKDGKLLPAFIKELKALGIPHPERFQPGSFLHGKTVGADGKMQSFHLAIDAIEDNPEENKKNGGNGKFITVKNLLTADGSVNKNWKKSAGEARSYFDLYALIKVAYDQREKGGMITLSTQAEMDTAIESGDLKTTVLRDDIQTLEDLNRALDWVDEKGARYPLKQGSTIQTWEPGDDHFWVYKIRSINERKVPPTIAISADGMREEILTYKQFFDNFQEKNSTRLPPMETADDFLQMLREHSPKGDKHFKDIIFDPDRGFIPNDKKDDKDFPTIVQFAGPKETISLFHGTNPATDGWICGEWEPAVQEDKEKGTKAKPGKYKAGYKGYKGSWNALFAEFINTKAVPVIESAPMKVPDKKEVDLHTHRGRFHSFLGNPSLHDMFTAVKNLGNHFKHHLERGSKLEADKFQLALAKKLGLPAGTLREIGAGVYDSTRKLMDEILWEFDKMNGGERCKAVLEILENDGAHDYEIRAAIITMLKSHGSLHRGSLQKLQGRFLFLERLMGKPYDPKNPEIIWLVQECANMGIIPPTEEYMCIYYIKKMGQDGHCDYKLWTQMNRAWPEGIKSEKEGGKTEAHVFPNVQSRLNVVRIKFLGNEVGNGIGAMEEVWDKGGTGAQMHLPAAYITLSGMAEYLHPEQIGELYNQFKSKAHPYPALAFLRTPETTALFQRVVGKLCKGNGEMESMYKAVESARKNGNRAKAIQAIADLWEKHGDTLHKKLVMSQDSEILFLAKTDPDCKAYVEHLGGFIHERDFNKEQIDEDVYTYEHSAWTWKADEWLWNLKFKGHGELHTDDKGTLATWQSFKDAIADVKKIDITHAGGKTVSDEANEAFRFERYQDYHRAFYKKVSNMGVQEFEHLGKQDYMNQLAKYGFSVPKGKGEDYLASEEYRQIVKEDYEKYKAGGRSTAGVTGVKGSVATNVAELFDGVKKQAANDTVYRTWATRTPSPQRRAA